jgi:hypothetical protein
MSSKLARGYKFGWQSHTHTRDPKTESDFGIWAGHPEFHPKERRLNCDVT